MRRSPEHWGGSSIYHLRVVNGSEPDSSSRRNGAKAVLVIGLACLLVAGAGLAVELLPRHFSAAQKQQISTWESARRWRDLPAGKIFPLTVTYGPPDTLDDIGTALTLTARRDGIASQASCAAATDKRAGTVLARNGCEAVLRATYADDTSTFVVTVGVAAFKSTAQAAAARQELSAPGLSLGTGRAPGVRVVAFTGTPSAAFTNGRRQLSSSIAEGPYVVMYAIGFADGRPLVAVNDDKYAESEMTALGAGVAHAAATVLGSPPPDPHCPGVPGC